MWVVRALKAGVTVDGEKEKIILGTKQFLYYSLFSCY
jgi:hypothetical protein